MASVTLEQVTKTFRDKTGEVRAVSDFNLTVADRELVVLVGPSGCGKTTTLRLVAGLDEVTAGTIRIGDRVVNRVAPKDRDVAMVFQNYALYPHMTVFKNMAFGLKMRRAPREEIKRKVGEVARLLGIERLFDRKPAALSGGERQRVALGRAIVRTPKVFLFDEPLSNLDAILRSQLRTEIKSLHQDLKATMIYVTHDQEEAMTLGDRIVILREGVIQQSGPPLTVYHRPVNRFVAGFIGTPPMNFLAGRLEGDGSAIAFAGDFGRVELTREIVRSCIAHAGRAIVLGIRPENVRLEAADGPFLKGGLDDGSENLAHLGEMTVRVVEPLGDSVNVRVVGPASEALVARVSCTLPDGHVSADGRISVPLSPGRRVRVLLDMSRAHFFTPGEDGERLTGN